MTQNSQQISRQWKQKLIPFFLAGTATTAACLFTNPMGKNDKFVEFEISILEFYLTFC